MPKNKKVSSRTQPTKIRKIANFFKPTSTAKKMLVFVVVFAIAGGGYYAYKSHAGSWTAYADQIVGTLGSTKTTDDHSSKGLVTVWKLNPTNGNIAAETYLGSPWNKSPGKTIPTRACVAARAPIVSGSTGTGISITFLPDASTGRWPAQKSFLVPQSSTYGKYCTDYTYVPGGASYIGNILIANSGNKQQLYVFSASLEW